MRGLFITFEGPDGSGKTSVAKAVMEYLKRDGYQAIHTREPGGIKIAEEIRNIILNPANTAMDPKTEALLYAASRRQHLVEKVIPALKSGQIVICERFIDSSLAYQGYGRKLGFKEILALNEFAIEGLYPDRTFYFQVAEAVGLKRLKGRDYKDRLDLESIAFHTRVNEGYQAVLKAFADRITVIDASLALEKVIFVTYQELKEYIDAQYATRN